MTVSVETVKAVTLKYGNLEIPVPVVLAPMAGITNTAFRRICREYGGGLFVSEMVTSRALVEGNAESFRLIRHHPSETVRSVQLYGVEPTTIAAAVRILIDGNHADHIDLNFGCPVPKVTRKGGGAALPWKLGLFTAIVRAAVEAAGEVPVTVKMRKGIDDSHITYLDAAKSARDEGVAAIALHARTAEQYYSGAADWEAIARLKETITDIPILGNGDIWSGADAVRMLRQTGADGVVVGRGCLGRPWLFRELETAVQEHFLGAHSAPRTNDDPPLGEVARAFRRHGELLAEFFESEERGCRDLRKHVAWYFKGYPVGGELRAALALSDSLEEIDRLLEQTYDSELVPSAADGPRGRQGTPQRCALPEGWLASRELEPADKSRIELAELSVSGG